MKWNKTQPIYQQLKETIVNGILEGVFKEGEPVPSIRHVSSEYQINPLTVSKAYGSLVDEKVLEKKRVLGMYVRSHAKDKLLQCERDKFLQEQLPLIKAKMIRLGLSIEELLS